MNKLQDILKVASNEKLCGTFYKMCLEKKGDCKGARPGQFVNIKINDGLEPFFRRPFGIAGCGKYLEIIYDVVGKGTADLSKKKRGEMLDVLGPLGNTFTAPRKTVKQIVLIAGGIGIAPLIFLADQLKSFKGRKVLLFGSRNKSQICSTKAFQDNGFKIFISTDDGSRGVKGRVSKLYNRIDDIQATYIYACGPKPMLLSVQDYAREKMIHGEASCEEVMACGVGTCLGCVTCTCDGYKTVCNDGPVFNLEELLFV